MSAPFIWIILPMLVSVILLIIRRNYALATLIQLAFCVLLIFFLFISRIAEKGNIAVFAIVIQPTLNILGRSFVLNDSQKFIIGLIYVTLAAWSLVLFIKNKNSKIIPLGLSLSSLLLAAMAVEPFLYSALIIEIAVIISILIAFDVETGKNKGIIRALIFFTLGMPFILLAGWYLAGGETSPINSGQLTQSSLLLGLGFVFWLGVFPFHSWIPLIMEESEISDSMYILTILPFSIIIILLKYLNGFAWLRDYQTVYRALIILGVVMVASGAVWSVFQTRFKKMIGYMVIFLNGIILIALGLNSSQGYLIFSELLLPRFLGLFLLTVSGLIISEQSHIDSLSDLKSIFYKFPFSSAGLMTALFTSVGMPLTNGFLPMQTLYQETSRNYLPILAIMIGSVGLLTFSFLRLFMVIMQPIEDEFEVMTTSESRMEKILIVILIASVLISGLLPNLIFPRFAQILNSFELLIK